MTLSRLRHGRVSGERPLQPLAASPANPSRDRQQFGKRVAYLWRRLLRVHATPHQIALGGALGVFAACTPFFGAQMLLAGGLAYMMRVSVAAALLGTFVGNPLSWPAIWSASYVAGAWMLGLDPAYAAEHLASNLSDSASLISASIRQPTPQVIDAAVVNLSLILRPLALGGMLIGLIAAALSYYPTRRAVRLFQTRRSLMPHHDA